MLRADGNLTEAGALGAFVVLVIALIRGMKMGALQDALMETAKLTVMIFALIWGVLIVRFGFGGYLKRSQPDREPAA